jgi:hypothetical protein
MEKQNQNFKVIFLIQMILMSGYHVVFNKVIIQKHKLKQN